MKVALYIRVSTERQANEGDSLEEQENELKKYCDFRKFAIHQTYIERGKSGGNTNRPEYQKLVKDIRQKNISAVVVKKLDRLSRSLLDFENLMNLMNENEVEFISIKENFDTTTAMGKAMLRVALVFAQLEREQTSERISDVMGHRASQGIYNGGTRPLGYAAVNKELVPYKKERQVVEIMFEKFIETRSTTHTAQFLNETGYRDRNNNLFDNRQVQWILQNPVYTGKIKWNGQIYDGLHQPIISDKVFQQTQDIFSRYRIMKDSQKTNALLQKILFCGHCGSVMTPNYGFNRNKEKYFYYRCCSTRTSGKGKSTCLVKYVPFAKIEQAVIDILLSLSQGQQFKELENKVLRFNQDIQANMQTTEDRIVEMEAKLEALKEKKETYLDSLISNQFLSKERELINARIEELESEGKQIRSGIQKNQFELNQKEDDKINLTQLKEKLIRFRSDYDPSAQTNTESLREHIFDLITHIFYEPGKVVVQFKALPWKEEFIN